MRCDVATEAGGTASTARSSRCRPSLRIALRSGCQARGQSLYDFAVLLQELAEASLKLRVGFPLRDVAVESGPDHFRGRNVVGASDRIDFDLQLIVNPDGRGLRHIADLCTSMAT